MFGLGKKQQDKISALEARLTALAGKVEHNNHEIAELSGQVASLEDLGNKVSELQTRQTALRTAMGNAADALDEL